MAGWIDKDGWIHCPCCGNKTRAKVNRDTILERFPLFCPKCGKGHVITVKSNNFISAEQSEPDAKTQSR